MLLNNESVEISKESSDVAKEFWGKSQDIQRVGGDEGNPIN